MSCSKQPWDTETHDPAELVSGMIKGSSILTMSEVREKKSNRDYITFWFFLQLYWYIRISWGLGCRDIRPP